MSILQIAQRINNLFTNGSGYFKKRTSRTKHRETLILLVQYSHAAKLFVTTVKWILKSPAECSVSQERLHSYSQPCQASAWFVLACSLAMSEETRACLVQVCNYCFCLLLRTVPNDPPQTWKSPSYRKKAGA